MPDKPTPASLVQLYSLDVADDDTAFGGSRSSRFCVFVIAAGTEETELDTGRARVRRRPEPGGGHVNAMAEYSPDLVRPPTGPPSSTG